jgi:hypothetical protein
LDKRESTIVEFKRIIPAKETNNHDMKQFFFTQKLNKLKTEQEEILKNIDREINDVYYYMNMKLANIEVYSNLKKFVDDDIAKLENELKEFVEYEENQKDRNI